MADIFISYAREDEARIQHLASALEEQGWSVFWDRRIPAGQTWRSYIGQALRDAVCVVVAWSRHSVSSKWVIEEAEEGQQRGILVPVLLDSIKPPIGFRSIQAGDLTDWQSDRPSPHFSQLIQDINTALGATPIPPTAENAINLEAKSHRERYDLPKRQPKVPSRHLNNALLAVILVLVAGIGYWAYKFTSSTPPSTQGKGEVEETSKVPSSLSPQRTEEGTLKKGKGVVMTSEGSFQFDRITGMSMGHGKLAVSQFGSRVDILLSKIERIKFLQGNAVKIEYKNGESEEANFSCYWNAPVTFHVGEKEIYYGDCAALEVVEGIEFFH